MKSHKVKELRDKFGETQIEFADRCKVCVRTVRAWESKGARGCHALLLDLMEFKRLTLERRVK